MPTEPGESQLIQPQGAHDSSSARRVEYGVVFAIPEPVAEGKLPRGDRVPPYCGASARGTYHDMVVRQMESHGSDADETMWR